MRAVLLVLLGMSIGGAPMVAGQAPDAQTPETFGATAQADDGAGAAVSAPIVIHIERYTPEFDRAAVEEALRVGGYPGFLPALRKAPDVGYVELRGRKTTIRWARQAQSPTGRTIVVVTDKPVAFIGGGDAAAKPRAGYEVAVIQLVVDTHNAGSGTMAAAARVKPGGATGVQVDDYASTPIRLVKVTRK